MNGMADNEDDDTFYDSEFPDIADDEFRELEQNAITFTQQEQVPLNTRKTGNNRNIIQSRTHNLGARAPDRQQTGVQQQSDRGDVETIGNDSFDSTILDEDGLPLVVEEETRTVPVPHRQIDETTSREQWRASRYGKSDGQAINRAPQAVRQIQTTYHPVAFQSQAYPGVTRSISQMRDPAPSVLTSALFEEEESLRTKIEELEANLRKANDEILTRRGEISNIRAQKAEVSKLHQQELNALKRSKQEEAEKHKAAIDALNADKGRIVTNIQLLKHDLEEESRKVQSLQRQIKERPLKDKPSNINITPKKNVNSLRDGFDDEDLMVMSPVKSGRRSKPATPTANRKRKQPTGNDLDIQPLVLLPSNSIPEANPKPDSEALKPIVSAPVILKDRTTQRHLRLIQQVLTFRPSGSQEVLTERLVKFSYPSDTSKSLSSTVMIATGKLDGDRLPGDLLQVFIDLWARALQERYYVIIGLLIEVINHILSIDLCVIDAKIIMDLVPLLQSTAEINAQIRFHLIKQTWHSNPEDKPVLNTCISTQDCLELLFTVASLVSDDSKLIRNFWQTMGTDFILMMLNACQPMSDISMTLQLLATSILPTTFGVVCVPEEQTRMEAYIIDRVLYLLWEQFKNLDSEPPHSRIQVCKVRLEALNFVALLTIGSAPNPYDPSTATNHGTTSLAYHATAIARLVRSIYDEVDAMYLLTPTQSLHAQLVNTAVHILYFILNSPVAKSPDFNLQLKLAGTNGGAHKHRVVLTRLTFSEGIGIDKGITDETVRMATELLEDSVTPDEARDLTAAFGGSVGRHAGGGRTTQG